MDNVTFSLAPFIQYLLCGKFVAPSSDWTHMSRQLSDYELFIVLEGVLYIADEKKNYIIRKNEYLIMTPGCKQYGFHPSSCSFYWMHFCCDNASQHVAKNITVPIYGTISNVNRFDILMAQLNDIVYTLLDKFTINLFATAILIELFHQMQSPENALVSPEDRLHRNIKRYIRWNPSAKLKINELAKTFGYHPKYLSTIFRKKEGIPLKQYILLKTMERAKSELVDTKKSVLSIALSMGYNDGQAFSNAFKHIVGVSPSDYRNNFQKIEENH